MTTLEERVEQLEKRFNEMDDEACQMTLGKIISGLEKYLVNNGNLTLDFGFEHPHCYRGYYPDVAVARTNNPQTLEEAIKVFKSAINYMFEGYKGGFFLMTENTKVWISPDNSEDTNERFNDFVLINWVQGSRAYQESFRVEDINKRIEIDKKLREKYPEL